MIEASIFAAMALVLDLLPSIKPMPNISISFAMVPVFIVAFRWGVKTGFISGLLWGILQILTGDAWIVTPVQGFIEYFVAFSCIGFAGFLSAMVQKAAASGNRKKLVATILAGTFVGSLFRYFWHFIAGVIFFANYAREAGKTPVVYSLFINGTTMFFTFILCSVVLGILLSIRPSLVRVQHSGSHVQKKVS